MSTRVRDFYLIEIAGEKVCPSTEHRIETIGLSEFTNGTQLAPPCAAFEKIDLAGKQRIDGEAERGARSARHGNLTGVHRAPRAGFRSRAA